MFDTIKGWYLRSGTILAARLEWFIGFLLAIFVAVDWTPLMAVGQSTDFTWNQVLYIAGYLGIGGLLREWIRRRGTVVKDDKLIPADVPVK